MKEGYIIGFIILLSYSYIHLEDKNLRLDDTLPYHRSTLITKQDSGLKLEFIEDLNIKIDGGCSFFTYDSIPLAPVSGWSPKKYILIISASKVAFISNQGEHVFFQHSKRIKNKTGYTDLFKNNTSTIKITITSIEKLNQSQTIRKGKLEIKHNSKHLVLPIHGYSEQLDEYRSN